MNIDGAKICAIFNFEFFSLSLNIMKRAEKGKENCMKFYSLRQIICI